uniref:Uncharacterized protein n=1 Tax=Vespula pensylvanica TaxID=30213 RepID=A0A834P166_VESPE|nr:hypothetical protein H0235_009152 [Vespula pensylvanica]
MIPRTKTFVKDIVVGILGAGQSYAVQASPSSVTFLNKAQFLHSELADSPNSTNKCKTSFHARSQLLVKQLTPFAYRFIGRGAYNEKVKPYSLLSDSPDLGNERCVGMVIS